MVFLESTYGDRDHRPFEETVHEFIEILQHAVARRSKVLVPTFAVAPARPRVVLTHGENPQRMILAKLIAERHGLTPAGDVIEL